MPHPELAAEQAYMDRAYEQLEAMRESARRMIASVIGQGRGITHQAREERDVIVRSSLQRLEQLDIGREALCFGRIDLERGAGEDSGNDLANGLQQGLGTGDTYYIGRLAVSGPDHEPLIVDWRAPVAEPFYRATGAHPMGLARRRHFLSEARTIVAMEDEVFGDADVGQATVGGILVASLERARTGQMRDIVATIQREQDEIIRAPLSGLLVVQGGPGTGKTAVALHRAAYLLYTHRFPLERQGVLVVGPNQVFLRYIEAVLPSLGESGAVLTTLGGLVPEARVRATEAPALAALKGQERMAAVLKAAVRGRERPLARDLEVPFGRYVLRITTEQTGAIVTGARRRHGTHNARRRFVEADLFRALHQRYAELAESRRASTEAGAGLSAAGPSAGEAEEAEEAAEASEGEASEQQPGGNEGLAEIVPLFAGEPGFGDELIEEPELRSQLRSHPAVANALDRMWPRLSAEELIHDLFGARPLLALAARDHLSAEEIEMLHRPRADRLETIPWTAADLALIDEAKVLLGPTDGAELRTYGHIVVDEAQDLSPMQLRMLARRSISGSMTVVGDVAQATGAEAPSGWAEPARHLAPRRRPNITELTVNYRTPAEIMDVAARVLAVAEPGLVPPRSVRSTGVRPRAVAVVPGEPLAEVVARTAREELEALGEAGGTVAVVASDTGAEALAPALADALARFGLDLGLPERDGLDRPVTLLPIGLVKGLEFDAVVVVEPDAILGQEAQGMRSLYVALTRATRRLAVVHARPLPDVLEAGGLETGRLEVGESVSSLGS